MSTTIETLAGRPRQAPRAIIQDPETLERIADAAINLGGVSYDLSVPGFLEYLRARGVAHHAGRPGTTWREWCAAPAGRTLEAFREQDEFQFGTRTTEDGDRRAYLPHEQEFHFRRFRRACAALEDCWELFQASGAGDHTADGQQPVYRLTNPSSAMLKCGFRGFETPRINKRKTGYPKARPNCRAIGLGPAEDMPTGREILTPTARAQRLLDEAQAWGVIFERHGRHIDIANPSAIPGDKFGAWKNEFNKVQRELALLLPDMDSLMQQPEGFVEVSTGNFVHVDDLPTALAMIAMTEPSSKQPKPEPKPTGTTGPQPNEYGVFLKDFCNIPWAYQDRKAEAAILVVEYRGLFYQSFEFYAPATTSCGLPSINHQGFDSIIAAQRNAAAGIHGCCEHYVLAKPNDKRIQKLKMSIDRFIDSISNLESTPAPRAKKIRAARSTAPVQTGWVQGDLFDFGDA